MGRIQLAPAAAVLGTVLSIGTLLLSVRMGPSSAPVPFIALSVSDRLDETDLREGLSSLGFPSAVSESTQRVFLDDFGELKSIALNEYRDFVEPFDPRDDGYAEALRSLFVSSGRRRVFIPLGPLASLTDPHKTGERIRRFFAGEDAQVYVHAVPRRTAPQAALLLGALVFALPAARPILPLLPCVPAVAALGLLGPAGLVLSGLAFALTLLLRTVAVEAAHLRSRGQVAGKAAAALLNDFSPRLAGGLAMVLLFMLLGLGASLPPVPLVLGLGSCVLLVWSVPAAAEQRRLRRGRLRFLPLPLIRSGFDLSGSARAALPFAAAALCSLILALVLPAAGAGDDLSVFLGEGARRITESDFRSHLEHQRSFSFLSLHRGESAGAFAYEGYQLGADGLISGSVQKELGPAYNAESIPKTEDAAEDLIQLLDASVRGGGSALTLGETAAVLFVLVLCIPSAVVRPRRMGRRGALTIHGEKRAAA